MHDHAPTIVGICLLAVGLSLVACRTAAAPVPAATPAATGDAHTGHPSHPATVEECAEIASRVIELEYQASQRAKPTPEVMQTILQPLSEHAQKSCIGRPVTDKTLQCVRRAASTDVMLRDCFD
jgi:hypothetical protein